MHLRSIQGILPLLRIQAAEQTQKKSTPNRCTAVAGPCGKVRREMLCLKNRREAGPPDMKKEKLHVSLPELSKLGTSHDKHTPRNMETNETAPLREGERSCAAKERHGDKRSGVDHCPKLRQSRTPKKSAHDEKDIKTRESVPEATGGRLDEALVLHLRHDSGAIAHESAIGFSFCKAAPITKNQSIGRTKQPFKT